MSKYYLYKGQKYTCSKCGWAGLGKVTTQGETFDHGFEIHCPKCSERIIDFIEFPTNEEALREGSPSDKASAVLHKAFQEKWQASLLKNIDQLPNLHYDFMAFVLREIEEDEQKFIVITLNNKVIWKEVLGYEYFERFIEIGKLFKKKYGKRMIDLVPDVDGYNLYGDKLHSLQWVERFRRELRENKKAK